MHRIVVLDSNDLGYTETTSHVIFIFILLCSCIVLVVARFFLSYERWVIRNVEEMVQSGPWTGVWF